MMKSVIGNSPWIHDFISSLPQPRQLTDSELDKNHPHCTIIHRKAVICDGDMKSCIHGEFPITDFITRLSASSILYHFFLFSNFLTANLFIRWFRRSCRCPFVTKAKLSCFDRRGRERRRTDELFEQLKFLKLSRYL